MQKLVFCASLVIALGAAGGAAQAQDTVDGQKVKEISNQNSVPPLTGENKSEQGGKTEPSAKIPDTNPNPNVLVNGVLAVPGAVANVDTAPAKFSERTNADDQLPIAGYRLKHLTSDQRSEIVQGLGSQRDSPSAEDNGAFARLGAEIPSSTAMTALKPMPDALTTKFVALRGTAFMRTAGKVLIVDLDNSVVVGVL
jgi:hypothetical protein